MKRVAALSAVLVASAVTNASAMDCRNIQFHDFSQPVIYCPAAMLCEIVMGNETIHRAFSAQAQQWGIDDNSFVSDPSTGRLSLILKPEDAGLTSNFRVFTSKHVFRFTAKSVPAESATTCTTRFLFSDVARAYARAHAPKPSTAQFYPAPPKPALPPKPLTRDQQLQARVDAAVAYTSSTGDQYGMDPQPPDYKIVEKGHSKDHTYIQFVALPRTPSTVPQIMDTEAQPRAVQATYNDRLRVYEIAGVSREYTLTLPDPDPKKAKKGATVSIRVQRQPREIARAR